MSQKPHVAIVIPARLCSTRLPEKMLADLAGKPLVVHTYQQALKAKLADEVVIATDDRKITDAVLPFGCKVILSPKTLKTGSDRVAFVAKSLRADVIVNLQGDEPLIHPKMIDQAIAPLLQKHSPACATLIKPFQEHALLSNPSVVKVVVDRHGFALYFSRSAIPYHRHQSERPIYYKHIGIYAYQRETLLAFRRLRPSPLEKLEGLEQLRLLENGY
ncbi:MAG: 3-deoxy-manno-octulosonate cytidylyltransferase [Chloroherpetonaceae bacterium]|nr:3-deoxy-manno-octulosonate cytidylyltransferase [Chloroherpetonaceae bacterium]